jgi:hypothetical protein
MSKTLAIMLTATLAVAVAAVTTTMQIQPAYSQATHCTIPDRTLSSRCVTPGQDPSVKICALNGVCGPNRGLTHQEAGQLIGLCHNPGFTGCTVTPPPDQ